MGETGAVRVLGSGLVLALLVLAGCNETPTFEAGVGSFNEGCGLDGTHSVLVADHSCACEAGYEWCSGDPRDFECCPIGGGETGTGGGETLGPEESCDEGKAEELRCVADPDEDDPTLASVWACNGERWVEVPGYADFACAAQGLAFAYGCVPGPEFVCGFGPGNSCEVAQFDGLCVDEDIIDTCVWGRRTIDRCERLCVELEIYGPGFTGGVCVEIVEQPAVCICT